MDFNVRPPGKSCAESGRTLQPGEACWSVLLEQDGKLVRQDISAEAWQGPPPGAIGHWRCVIPESADSGRLKLDADSLFDYFLQLNESPNSIQQQYRYVLSLLLLRKRRLILEEVRHDEDGTVMRLLGSGGEGQFDVLEEELSEEQIQRLQNQLFESGRSAAA